MRSRSESILTRWVGVVLLAWIGGAAPAFAAVTLTASATSASGSPLSALPVGDLVTIDITLRSDGVPVYALQASATGYDPNGLGFVSGEGAGHVLSLICLPQGCFGGIENDAIEAPGIREDRSNPLGPQVRFMRGLTIGFTSQTGAADLGVSGIVGDPQFRLMFRARAPGATTIEIGANLAYGDASEGEGGLLVPTSGASVDLLVVPEPSVTTLFALGLAGLTRGRRPRAPGCPSPRA